MHASLNKIWLEFRLYNTTSIHTQKNAKKSTHKKRSHTCCRNSEDPLKKIVLLFEINQSSTCNEKMKMPKKKN